MLAPCQQATNNMYDVVSLLCYYKQTMLNWLIVHQTAFTTTLLHKTQLLIMKLTDPISWHV